MLKIFSIIFISFLLSTNFISNDKNHTSQIDSLLQKSYECIEIDEFVSLNYALDASKLAEEINDSKRKAYSYICIAKRYNSQAKYKESIEYIEKTIDEEYTNNCNDELLQGMISLVKANNYSVLGFETEALVEYNSVLKILEGNKTKEAILLKLNALIYLGSEYFIDDDNEKALEYFDKAEYISKEKVLSNENIISDLADLYELKGNVFLYANNNDSAFVYIKKAFEIINQEQRITKYSQYSAMGDYYFKIQNHKIAIEYYLKALDDMISHHINDMIYKIDIYNRLDISYHLIGDVKNSEKYKQKYFSEKTMSRYVNEISIEAAFKLITKEKDKVFAKQERKKFYIFTLTVIILLFLVFIVIMKYRSIKMRKKILLQEKEIEIKQKQNIIIQKEEETKELKQKVNESFNEVLSLAKDNDPAFATRFKEVYPEFSSKLLQKHPDLINTEFSFCAMIFFNLSSKEIAKFTYVEHRSIQTRKSRLRKKLKISSATNLYDYLRSFSQELSIID